MLPVTLLLCFTKALTVPLPSEETAVAECFRYGWTRSARDLDLEPD